MLRKRFVVAAALGLPLGIAGCESGSSPVGTPVVEQETRSGQTALARKAPGFRSRLRFRQLASDVLFSTTDGCILTEVAVLGAQDASTFGIGKEEPFPFAFFSLFQYNYCSSDFEVFRDVSGSTDDVTFEADRRTLSEARLRASFPATDNLNGGEVQVVVDLLWSATGKLSTSALHSRSRRPGEMVTSRFHGTSRDAVVSGTVTVDGEAVDTDALESATILRMKGGELTVVRAP